MEDFAGFTASLTTRESESSIEVALLQDLDTIASVGGGGIFWQNRLDHAFSRPAITMFNKL